MIWGFGVAIGIIGLIVFSIWIFFRYSSSGKKEPYFLGTQILNARIAEERRVKERGPVESPMPKGGYNFWQGEESMIKPVKTPFDDEVGQFCRIYSMADKETRSNLCSAISMDEFYTLMTFSRRHAVFAMRERATEHLVNALTALAMIEKVRVDYRDILWVLSYLYYVAVKINQNPVLLFNEAAALAEEDVSKLMLSFSHNYSDEKEVSKSWGFYEVKTEVGLGFIRRDAEAYDPSYDLARVALEISDLIEKDIYQPDGINIASGLPKYWLSSVDDELLEKSLKSICAGATIKGRLRPEVRPEEEDQSLLIFLVEVDEQENAQILLNLSKRKDLNESSMIGIACNKLFVLLIQRAFIVGVEAYETPAGLSRFAARIEDILNSYGE